MSTLTEPVAAVGWAVHLPGPPLGEFLAEGFEEPPGDWAYEEAAGPARAATVLGRKGLLAKEPATRTALCAVHRALGLPAGARPDQPLDPGTAVVVASNLGNVATVAAVSRTVATEGGAAVSVLDAPNVSSNVIASSIALWFRFGGPNLMVCSGDRAGADALRLAGLLLRAGRADRVVVVGVEPDDEVAAALHGAGRYGPPLRGGAACLVLRSAANRVPAGVCVEPAPAQWPVPPRLLIGPGGLDLRGHGDLGGARHVVSLALAAHLAADDGHRAVGVSDDEMSLLVTATVARRAR
ncbi:beta-ketoacyl synthase N-terminal-like domain-containing protein [Actinoplanes sp. NPDC051861]|uniref:beta-ketoacyl synthase N-terminal-like domain-containing protein n=1 Tax=Actinoplanes sp. NPDC051861 TaxID=3155170 RepID=UPI00342F5146